MPRVDKWLYADVQKHKRNAGIFEEGYGRKGGGKGGSKRAWAMDERDGGNHKSGAGRKGERSFS